MTNEDTSQKTIGIVDDHTLFTDSLEKLIETFSEFKVVVKASHGIDLQHQLATLKLLPKIILLDVNMPLMDGIETAKWLRETHPQIKVLALSMNDEEDSIIKMFRSGARGYLLKDTPPKEFKKALEILLEHGYYNSEEDNELINRQKKESEKVASLKENEIAFMKLACSEMTYNEIANKMMLSPKTIDGYRQSLFEKLNVRNRIGLAMYAIKNKYVQF